MSAEQKWKIEGGMFRLRGVLKSISPNHKNSTAYTVNAQSHYLTPGLFAGIKQGSYFGTAGAFFGKRVFGVMADGTRIQHHAMEFDRTYRILVGKAFGQLRVALQYNALRATELPFLNSNVNVHNIALSLKYSL